MWCWLACRVLLKIIYLLTCRVLSLAVLVLRGDRAKDAELLVLRHENAVLRRHAGRVRYEPADRAWFAAMTRLVPRRRWKAGCPSWSKGAVCKTVGVAYPGSNPGPATSFPCRAVRTRVHDVGSPQECTCSQMESVRFRGE
jgi:hypothetical protein